MGLCPSCQLCIVTAAQHTKPPPGKADPRLGVLLVSKMKTGSFLEEQLSSAVQEEQNCIPPTKSTSGLLLPFTSP